MVRKYGEENELGNSLHNRYITFNDGFNSKVSGKALPPWFCNYYSYRVVYI